VTRKAAFLALGSNLGDRAAMLQLAVDEVAAAAGVTVVQVSRVYETTPVGGPEQDDYLNAVVRVDTELDARELLELAQQIEQHAGRVRSERWGPRSLDVDVLIVGETRVDEPDLQVPHPRMYERGFVLAPLHDVAPERVAVPAEGWEGVRDTAVELRLP